MTLVQISLFEVLTFDFLLRLCVYDVVVFQHFEVFVPLLLLLFIIIVVIIITNQS